MVNSVLSPVVGTEHEVKSDGYRLFVWEKSASPETRSDKVALMVHGATYSGTTDFDIQVPAHDASFMEYLAARGTDVFTFDVRGYGRSQKPDDADLVTTDAAARDIDSVSEYICASRGVHTVDLLGWSWGGLSSALYASRKPARVRRLVLYAGGASQGAGANAAAQDAWIISTRENIMARIEQDVVVPEAQEAFITAALRWDLRSPVSGRRLTAPDGKPWRAAPEQISVPTLVIYGARDPGYRAEEVAGFVARLNTSDKALVVVPGAGHSLIMQKQRVRLFSAVEHWFNYA